MPHGHIGKLFINIGRFVILCPEFPVVTRVDKIDSFKERAVLPVSFPSLLLSQTVIIDIVEDVLFVFVGKGQTQAQVFGQFPFDPDRELICVWRGGIRIEFIFELEVEDTGCNKGISVRIRGGWVEETVVIVVVPKPTAISSIAGISQKNILDHQILIVAGPGSFERCSSVSKKIKGKSDPGGEMRPAQHIPAFDCVFIPDIRITFQVVDQSIRIGNSGMVLVGIITLARVETNPQVQGQAFGDINAILNEHAESSHSRFIHRPASIIRTAVDSEISSVIVTRCSVAVDVSSIEGNIVWVFSPFIPLGVCILVFPSYFDLVGSSKKIVLE